MEIGRPFNFVGRGELLQERIKRFRRAADDGAAVANQHRALQQLRMRRDGFEQRVVRCIGQIEVRVFVFVFADQAAQRFDVPAIRPGGAGDPVDLVVLRAGDRDVVLPQVAGDALDRDLRARFLRQFLRVGGVELGEAVAKAVDQPVDVVAAQARVTAMWSGLPSIVTGSTPAAPL